MPEDDVTFYVEGAVGAHLQHFAEPQRPQILVIFELSDTLVPGATGDDLGPHVDWYDADAVTAYVEAELSERYEITRRAESPYLVSWDLTER